MALTGNWFSRMFGKSAQTPEGAGATASASTAQRSSSMAPEVKVYALSTCIHCKKAKEYLDKCGVLYDCVHVDLLTGQERKDMVEEVKKFYREIMSFDLTSDQAQAVLGGKLGIKFAGASGKK